MNLIEAASDGRLERVKRLCDQGVNIEGRNHYGETALTRAVCSGHVDIVKELCDRGAKWDKLDAYEMTPLRWSLTLGDTQIFKEFCRRGAVPEYRYHPQDEFLVLIKQQEFRRNVLVLIGEGILSVDLLRVVHQWI